MIEINCIKDQINLSDVDLLNYIDEICLKDSGVQKNNINVCFIRIFVTQDISIKLVVGNPNNFIFSNPKETHFPLSKYISLTLNFVNHSDKIFDMSKFNTFSWFSLFHKNKAQNISQKQVCEIIRDILRQDNLPVFK